SPAPAAGSPARVSWASRSSWPSTAPCYCERSSGAERKPEGKRGTPSGAKQKPEGKRGTPSGAKQKPEGKRGTLLGFPYPKEKRHMAKLEKYGAPGVFDPPGYSQAIKVTGAQTILFLAGQVAYTADGNAAHPR